MMQRVSMALLWFIFLLHPLRFSYANFEVDALTAFKNKLADPNNVLQSWDSTFVNPCTWFRITCNYDDHVTRINLSGSNLSGTLVPELGQLKNLIYLGLADNNITGTIPDEFGNLTSLLSLDLYMNNLSGPIPSSLGKLSQLRFLRLDSNRLTGCIPTTLTDIQSLLVLDLSKNDLSGVVPVNGSFSRFTPLSFCDNPHLSYPGQGQVQC